MTDTHTSLVTTGQLAALVKYLETQSDRLTKLLDDLSWTPRRSHTEGARNAFITAANTLGQALNGAPAQLPASPVTADAEGARLSSWLADYSHDLMEEGNFDQEAKKLAKAAQWIADQLRRPAQQTLEKLPCEMCAGSKWKNACPECDGTGYYTPDPALPSTPSAPTEPLRCLRCGTIDAFGSVPSTTGAPGGKGQTNLHWLVDWVHLYATEGHSWISRKSADHLIALAARKPTQADADHLKTGMLAALTQQKGGGL